MGKTDPLGFKQPEPIVLKPLPKPERIRRTRDEAIALRLPTYYDGNACARGHVDSERYTANGTCCTCHAQGFTKAGDGDMRGVTHISLRLAAHDRGDVTYKTGKPCIRGHDSERYTSTGACVECLHPKRVGGTDRRVKYPYRSQHTGTRYRAVLAEDGRLVLEWRATQTKLGQLCMAADHAVFERFKTAARTTEWKACPMHPDLVDELLAIMLTAQAAPLPKM